MDKELFFKPNLSEEELDVPGRGTIRIRTMSREELHRLQHKDTGVSERRLLAACLVDPELTQDEVLKWQKAAPVGEISAVVEAIMKLSGLDPDAAKSGLRSDGDD